MRAPQKKTKTNGKLIRIRRMRELTMRSNSIATKSKEKSFNFNKTVEKYRNLASAYEHEDCAEYVRKSNENATSRTKVECFVICFGSHIGSLFAFKSLWMASTRIVYMSNEFLISNKNISPHLFCSTECGLSEETTDRVTEKL